MDTYGYSYRAWANLFALWWRVHPNKQMPPGKRNPFIVTTATATRWLIQQPLPQED